MRDAFLLFRSFAPVLIKVPSLGLAAIMVFVGLPQTDHANSSTPGVIIFDAPGAGTTTNAGQGTSAFGINASGEVVGSEIGPAGVHHGYVRAADGTITKFDVPGAGTMANQGTLAWGINTGGDVTGYYTDMNQIFHGFIRSAAGTFTTFDVPGAVTTNAYNAGTTPFAIDAGGDVTGYYTSSNGALHGFVRLAGGTMTPFDVTGAGTGTNQGTRPIAINSAGEIAGVYLDSNTSFHGFFRTADGTITSFDAPGAGTGKIQGTFPTAIDMAGDIVGFYGGSSAMHGFVRKAGGTFSSFDAPGAGTGMLQGTLPFGINASGAIVGVDLDASYLFHGFERGADGTLTTIDAPGAGTSGTALNAASQNLEGTGAFGINDLGEIAGFDLDPNAVAHGFVVPAPAAVPASFKVSGTALSISPGATSGNTSTITVTPSGNFTGAVALTASVTASPSGAIDPPTLSFGSTSPVNITGPNAGTATLTISTTAASSAAFAHPLRPGLRWYGAGSVVLGCVLFLGVPARRRGWVRLLSLLLFFAAIGGVVLGCSGSGGNSAPTNPSNPGTTPGNYVVTVTGASGGTNASATVTLTVQ